jgi:hypothetical protein
VWTPLVNAQLRIDGMRPSAKIIASKPFLAESERSVPFERATFTYDLIKLDANADYARE